MKGIVLAGGTGSRLFPLTKVTNKHLLPVYDRPMIHYPIRMLQRAGIEDILVVTGGHSASDFLRLLGDGREFGLPHLYYAYQQGEGGIAEALKVAAGFARGDSVCVVLGDNLIQGDIRPIVERFKNQPRGARVLLKEVEDPQRYGVARFEGNRIVEILEKPDHPPSKLIVTGIYLFDERVFDICERIAPSARGELEITDVNNFYIRDGCLEYDRIDGWWIDAGTYDSLLAAAQLVAADQALTEVR